MVKPSHDIDVAVHADGRVTVSADGKGLEAFELGKLTHRKEVCIPNSFKILYRASSRHNENLLTNTAYRCVFKPPLVTALWCELG